jgi:hypothetical protein
MLDNAARVIATVGIWISFAIVMAGGVCRMNFNGDSAVFGMIVVVALICAAAAISTWFVWKSPLARNPLDPTDERPSV